MDISERLIVVHFAVFPYPKDNIYFDHINLLYIYIYIYDNLVGDDRPTRNKTNTKPINFSQLSH